MLHLHYRRLSPRIRQTSLYQDVQCLLAGLALPNDLSADLETYNKELNSHLMGGFGVIRLGMLRNGQRVAIKTLKLHHVGLANIRHSKVCIANLCDSSLQNAILIRIHREFTREMLVWNGLKHPNILPFLGFVELPSTVTRITH